MLYILGTIRTEFKKPVRNSTVLSYCRTVISEKKNIPNMNKNILMTQNLSLVFSRFGFFFEKVAEHQF